MRYKFDKKVVNYNYEQGGVIHKDQAIVIVIKDEEETIYPHPITHFMYTNYNRKSGSINNELVAANIIVPFLNHIYKKIEENDKCFLDVKGLCDLRVEHADSYLKYCVSDKENLNSTLDSKEYYISKFYKYLDDEGILTTKPDFYVRKRVKDGDIHITYILKFTYKRTNETLLRRKIKRKDIVPQRHSMSESRQKIRMQRIYEFLLLAKQETPDIAFGVALSIFAGLRKGEVVNLLRNSIKPQKGYKYGENGMIVKVKNNQSILFQRLKEYSKEEVKKEREQACLIDGILCYLYKFHIESVIPKIKNKKNSRALFYDANGEAMSGSTFDRRFLQLKQTYIGLLLQKRGRYEEYLDFSDTRWRSHIGRGIFTNMCHDCGYSVEQTAILRGDSSTESMKAYFDIISATHNISKALELMAPNSNDLNRDISLNIFEKSFREVVDFGKK